MSKRIPTEAVIILHNRLAALPTRSQERIKIVEETAKFYGVSNATIYRALRKYSNPRTTYRMDYNQPRITDGKDMHLYCELVAALKKRTTNKKGRHLSTKDSIKLLETYGIETPDGLVKAPIGLLNKTTINRYLCRWGLDKHSMGIEPTVVHFQAEESNECWQFDFSTSELKKLKNEEGNTNDKGLTLMLASVVDDRSGLTYQEYHYVYGEDVMTALRFLFNAMAPKKHKGCPFQGIPQMIYLDNGPVAKSKIFKRVMAHLGIEIRVHMPAGKDKRRKTARSKGKVERAFRTLKGSLEPLYHFHKPKDLKEANEWLRHYLLSYNEGQHRIENHSRLEDWKQNLPTEGYRKMCTWERFSSFAREPEQRIVLSDACINVYGIRYQLSNEMAGQEVTLLLGLFDNELHVEYNNKKFGPFYPAAGPAPLKHFRSFKKSSCEKRADKIDMLAKQITISRAALSGKDANVETLLSQSKLIPFSQPYIPFEDNELVEVSVFKTKIEAKIGIAKHLGYPLAHLNPQQIEAIETILTETLDKKTVIAQIKNLFKLQIVSS